MPAPATTSHTSFPSQNGPMAFRAIASLGVGPAREHVQHADAEVEPFEHEESDPQDGQDDKPEGVKMEHRSNR